MAVREQNLKLAKWASVLTVLGIVLNRFNVSWFAFNWQLPAADRYFPSWMEIVISIYIVTIGVLVFRFISTKMPIFYEHPSFREHAPHEGATGSAARLPPIPHLDAFARSIITASGSNKDNPPAAYFKVLREPTAMMENTTQLFLGVRFNCNKCHDHPFEHGLKTSTTRRPLSSRRSA